MKKLTTFLLLLAFSLSGYQVTSQSCFQDGDGNWVQANGADCVNSIITAVPFLRIVPDARSGAMGDVGIAISPDANSIHYNASKLAFVDKDISVAATYTPWLRALGIPDVYLAYIAGYKQINDLQTVGLSLRYFSLGDIAFTDEQGGSLGNGRPNEFEIALAYARKLSPKLSVAVTPKFIYSNLAGGQSVEGIDITPGVAGAADFSLTYKTPLKLSGKESDLTVGFAVSNLGTKISYTKSINKDYIPTNLGLGAAWNMNIDEFCFD